MHVVKTQKSTHTHKPMAKGGHHQRRASTYLEIEKCTRPEVKRETGFSGTDTHYQASFFTSK
jgi:hypothetical protein